MENATKALLIAAAVLIAILIISFALIIYNMAAETAGNVNLSEAEMTQFNSKFTAFEGSNVSGAQVNALLTTVLTHNQREASEGTNRQVKVSGEVTQETTATSITKVPSNGRYTVTCILSKGLVNEISIDDNSTTNKPTVE